jgi:predicted AAA+ superfamily ATPase
MLKRAVDMDSLVQPGKTLLLLGPRRTGKTTLLNSFVETSRSSGKRVALFNGDSMSDQEIFSKPDRAHLDTYISGYDIIALDEAQSVPQIGKSLKLINDSHPELIVVATGSSSFELHGQVGEPLVGRKRTAYLYPLWIDELLSADETVPPLARWRQLRDVLLVYGSYPQSVIAANNTERTEFLTELVDSLLLRDILTFQEVKGSRVLHKLLVLLAHQVGSEVSLSELASNLGINKITVDRYLDLLEKSYIVFRLGGFSRNMRSEVTRTAKYYFYDVGVRNAIINNLNPLGLRDDVGKLWENYALVERLKARSYLPIHANQYFWRTWKQSEIDLIEERDGALFAYEFKWNTAHPPAAPKEWVAAYPDNTAFSAITPDTFLPFACPSR